MATRGHRTAAFAALASRSYPLLNPQALSAHPALLLSLPLGLGLSLLVEQGLSPRPQRFWARPRSAIAIHLALWTLLYGLLLLSLQRPWFAFGVTLALQLFLIVVNNVKVDALKEPFLVQDFDYFWDMLKHPRLYIPFFGLWRSLIFSGGGLAVIVGGLWLEPRLTDQGLAPGPFYGALLVLLGVAALTLLAVNRRPGLSAFDPDADFRRLGQLACFWHYGRALFGDAPLPAGAACFEPPAHPPEPAALPNLVLVQSESFADPRRLSDAVAPSLLANYDRLRGEARQQGRLTVPAWGANTVRTECAVLTGLTSTALGIHAFSPYRTLARQALPNLAGYLKTLGYRTLCIHPYPAGFYLRETVFPRLGFDQFIDIGAFAESDKQGQYTGDLALAERISTQLREASDQPLFIFVITMENHGPLHLEREDPALTRTLCRGPLPEGCSDLAVYLGHIRNADRMIEQLATELAAAPRPGVLGWYGDHLPIMPAVYQQLGVPDGRTDYLIWRSDRRRLSSPAQDLRADQLPAALIQQLLDSRG